MRVPDAPEEPRDTTAHMAGPRPDPAIMTARYGRTRTSRRTIVIGAVIAALLVGGGIAVQAANFGRNVVVTEPLGFTVDDATSTTVRFSVRTDPGTTVRCSVVALNDSFTQIGYREVDIGPVEQRTTSHEVVVTTTELATSGGVDECQILADPGEE